MPARRVPGRDGATSVSPATRPTSPALVACPLPTPGGATVPIEALYRAAYERAREAARPSLYESAMRAWCN